MGGGGNEAPGEFICFKEAWTCTLQQSAVVPLANKKGEEKKRSEKQLLEMLLP